MIKKSLKKAQVLLPTLIVLSVVGVLITGMIIIFNRDSSQVINTEKYQEILNVAETDLVRIAREYFNPSTSIESLVSDGRFQGLLSNCSFRVNDQTSKTTICKSISEQSQEKNLDTEISITDSKQIIDYEMSPDQPLTIDLSGYRSSVIISSNVNTPLEISINYTLNGNSQVLRGFIDTDLLIADQATKGNIQSITSFPQTNTISLNLSALPLSYLLQNLQITFRSSTNLQNNVTLTVVPNNYSDYPYQIREASVRSFDLLASNSPVVNLVTKSPLRGEVAPFLDYPLLTKDNFIIE